jgi:hypothetical protein
MTGPEFDPLRALAVLQTQGVRFVVIGGFAAALRGSPLITGDLDICYARDDANLEAVAAALRELNATLRGAPPDLPFKLDATSLRNGDQFTFSTAAGSVDILGAPAGTSGFADLNRDATDEEVDGLKIRVASLDDLIRMKDAAGRAKDRLGLEWLAALKEELDQG